MHAFFSKIVDERSLFRSKVSADYSQIFADRGVGEKLFDQSLAIARGLGEKEDSGGETIDAMDDQGSLMARLQVLRENRHHRWRAGVWNGDSQKARRLVDRDDGVIFVENCELARETRPTRVLRTGFGTTVAWDFFHRRLT